MNAQAQKLMLSISDAVGMVDRPLRALQAVEQLTHPTSAQRGSIDLQLLDREALGYLLTVIYLDFERTLSNVRAVIAQEQS
ncbi:hypothetical protein EBQ24_08750 [Allofranklinella schreckenbergeri]|uniref:Uncharacterized protein n=1 Tax=Allofranklinella schreckenbergeri TaxID=1076744 RepID=A0A3M6QWL9_9BURK|nr:hypothetical protein [Allofranklinella schreckenbergeri]RMX07415.1 hypothetical protein EBQ24_08750 [Allofranklinella schreckenbergeri]